VGVESSARNRLCGLLAEEPDVKVVGECSDGCQASLAIGELKPDLVFLGVQAPDVDGLHVLQSAGADHISPVILVTAYDQYALRTFDARVADYVIEPFGCAGLHKALEDAREQISPDAPNEISGRLVALPEEMRPREVRFPKRIMIRERGRLFFLRTADIDWVEASGNYSRLHVGAESHLLRQTMNGLVGRLDPEQFLRIHRSTIVNIERVKELRPLFRGAYTVVLKDERQLLMSAAHRRKLDDLL
jgi:two-component system, LytTR family, response regulator